MVANFAYVWITSAVLQVLLSPAINIIMSHYRINAIIQKRAGLITAPTGYRATLGHAAGQVRAIVDTLALLIMCIAFGLMVLALLLILLPCSWLDLCFTDLRLRHNQQDWG